MRQKLNLPGPCLELLHGQDESARRCSLDEIAKRLSSSSRPLLYNTNKKQKLNDLWSERSSWYESTAHNEIDITGLSELHAVQRLYKEIR